MILNREEGKRLNAIVENNLEGVYALGQAKNLDDYSLFSGLDIKNKQVLDPGNVFNFNKLKDLKWNQDSEKQGYLVKKFFNSTFLSKSSN